MARTLAATVFLAASPAGRRTLLADRFLPLLESDPELAAALVNALPSAEARAAFSVLVDEYRKHFETARIS